MKLVIFDVDGTLTQPDEVDERCFVRSFADEFQIEDINTDWATYGHTTYSGITLQIFQERLGRSPQPDEMKRLRERFRQLLADEHRARPRGRRSLYMPIAGAAKMLMALWTAKFPIALVTSCWRDSATTKVVLAGLFNEFPVAAAEDGISREEIVTTAIDRSGYFYGKDRFERIVFVGNDAWDLMTAAQLNLPFIGIDSDRSIPSDWGVQTIENFEDLDRFLQLLDTATVPNFEKLLDYQQQTFRGKSLPPSYFEALYANRADPWGFETSPYEAEKYAATIAALPRRYRSGFEIGGSIGVLTQKLAGCCDALLSVDLSQLAQQRAIDRCFDLPHVRFQIMNIPDQYPDQQFDLTLVSEVGYYWSWEILRQAQQQILEHLEVGGHLLLVHWTGYARDYPLNGNDVHEAFLELVPAKLRHLSGQRQTQYRLDLFERV